MKRSLSLLVALAGLAAIAPSAHAATPNCNRGGAKVIATEGNVSVVSVAGKPKKGGDVPMDTVYGCWIPSGKRFQLFRAYLSDEGDRWTIVDGRYIGVYRSIEAGVAGSADARSWDARKGVALYHYGKCPADPEEDEVSDVPHGAVFYARGGFVYWCGDGSTHLVDAKGDRALEPGASGFAVTSDGRQLYYTVGDTLKSLQV